MEQSEETSEMQIPVRMILQALWHRAWIIVLCAIVGFVGGYIYTLYFVDPVYSTTMKVSTIYNTTAEGDEFNPSASINELTLSQRQVNTYIELLKATKFYQMVADESNTGYSWEDVRDMLSFEQVEDLPIFQVTVTGTDSLAIMEVANATSKVITPYIDNLQPQSNLTVYDSAKPPDARVTSILRRNGLIVGVVLAGIAAVVIALYAFFDTHIKDEETLSKRYGIPILGTIPDFNPQSVKHSRGSERSA